MTTNFQSVMTGTPEKRVEALQQLLGYPLNQRDPEKNLFWYLCPGAREDAASENQPVAVGFTHTVMAFLGGCLAIWPSSAPNSIRCLNF
jgi:hypothetical protein